MITLASSNDSRWSLHGLLAHIPGHVWAPPPNQRLIVTWSKLYFRPLINGGPNCSFHSTLEAQSSTTCVTSVNTVNAAAAKHAKPKMRCAALIVPFASAAARNPRLQFLYGNFFTTFGRKTILYVISIKAPPIISTKFLGN